MNRKIAVAGTGYVGLSLAVLLSQKNQVTAVDIIPEKVELINHKKSPIQDDYIEKYLAEKNLNLTATLDAKAASTIPRKIVSIRCGKRRYDNSTAFYEEYFGQNCEKLVAAIKAYKQHNGSHKKDEHYLAELLK